MAVTYGDAILDSARSVISTSLNALVANMVTNTISPRLLAVYDTHYQEVAPTKPSVMIGLGVFRTETEASGSGLSEQIAVTVELRIPTGDTAGSDCYRDETEIDRLLNSVLNWLEERRSIGTSGNYQWHIIGPFNGKCDATWDFIKAIGGELTFVMKTWARYTPA